MPATKARYDGHADWYDDWNQPHVAANAAKIVRLLGPGQGPCLDVGCGGGGYLDALAAAGWTVVGLDRSADQLRHARHHSPHVIHGDAAALPFRDGCFGAVAAIWISTDVDDFTAVLAEAARVLRPGGSFVFYGAHPCFNGPHVEWMDDGGVRAHPGYRRPGWHQESPWWGIYVRRRVGMRHHPLAELLTGFIRASLLIEQVAEHGERAIPTILAIRARKTG
ncbi:MAG TPA: class I SAM-dependent methyltransferase [Streptosporangiaceae bacterium]|nr:class I SAM-dependent methyltransferase [Streptosporangiaceae bacterium]